MASARPKLVNGFHYLTNLERVTFSLSFQNGMTALMDSIINVDIIEFHRILPPKTGGTSTSLNVDVDAESTMMIKGHHESSGNAGKISPLTLAIVCGNKVHTFKNRLLTN